MGTSTSSKGPGSNVPFVPPWVDSPDSTPTSQPTDIPPDGPELPDAVQNPIRPLESPKQAQSPPVEYAPPRRFAASRMNLGRFAKSGSRDDLRRGLGHYSRNGMGGAQTASRRMGGTAQTASGLYNVLDALSKGNPLPADLKLDPKQFTGHPQEDVAALITDALRPIDGTQDGDSARDAMSRAFSELLTKEPDVNLQELSETHIDFVIEAYIANDLANRISLDVGKAILDKASSSTEALERLEEMKSYVRQEVALCFRARADKGETLTRQNSAKLSSRILKDAFEIFESYL